MKKRLIILFFWLGIILLVYSLAVAAKVGDKAPFFKVVSGDDKDFSLNDIKDKVAVLFYETKDTKEVNRALKNALNRYYDGQKPDIQAQILRVAVINCNGVFFTKIWKGELRKNSQQEGIVIYGDWDGKMFSDFGFKDNDSNVVIIDKKGFIRYFAFGKIQDAQIQQIKNLLKLLAQD